MDKNERIFIAGAYGVAGSAIFRQLQQKGYKKLLIPSHKELDLKLWDQVNCFFKTYRPTYVFYTAAKMGNILYRNTHPVEILLENLLMQSNVIKCAHEYGTKKLLFMSSDFIYPDVEKENLHEKDFLKGLPCTKDFPYSLAKITGVKLCDYYREEYGDNFFTVVPCAFFGINSTFDIERANVVASLIHRMYDAKIANDKEFILWGTGKPVKEFLFSEDVASACLLLMEKELKEGLYNIGSGSGGTSILDLVYIIKDIIGYKGKIVCDTTKPDGILRRIPDSSRLQSLGWKPIYDLETSIRFMYKYFLDTLQGAGINT